MPSVRGQFDVGLERAIGRFGARAGDALRREDTDFLRRAGAEPRLVNGRFVPGSRNVLRYENRVAGLRRGSK